MRKKVRGSNTLGYGKTKQLVIDAVSRGLCYEDIIKETGLSGASVRACAARNKLRLKTRSGRSPYGKAKQAAHHAWTTGCGYEEAARLFKCKPVSVKRNLCCYGKRQG